MLWLLRCNINAGVHWHGRSGRVTQRFHNSPEEKRDQRVRVKTRTGSGRRIFKKSVELSSASGEEGWLSLARRSQASGLVAGAARVGEGAQMEKPE